MQHTHEGMHEDIKDFSAYKNVIYDADYEQRILQSHHFMIYNNYYVEYRSVRSVADYCIWPR